MLGIVTGPFYNISQESKQTENYLGMLELPEKKDVYFMTRIPITVNQMLYQWSSRGHFAI